MAQIGAPHGLRGDVRVRSFGEDPLALGDFKQLYSESGAVFRITSLRTAKGDMLIARFKGVADRSAAEALSGMKLYVERNQLPDPAEDEFYQTDLVGCTAVDETGETVGEVLAVMNFGAGDLLDIQVPDGESILVPFTESFIPRVDIANRQVVVSSLQDLLADDAES